MRSGILFRLPLLFLSATVVVELTTANFAGTPINAWVKFACAPENIKVLVFVTKNGPTSASF